MVYGSMSDGSTARVDELNALDAFMRGDDDGDPHHPKRDHGQVYGDRRPLRRDHALGVQVRSPGQETWQAKRDDNANRMAFEAREWCRETGRLLPPVSVTANELLAQDPEPARQAEARHREMVEATRRDLAAAHVTPQHVADAFATVRGRPSRARAEARSLARLLVRPVVDQAVREGCTYESIAEAIGCDVQHVGRLVREN